MNKNLTIIAAYFIFLLILAPYNLLSSDTYYYWDWSRHLELSYFDGPPMIAYLIKASTMLFGHTMFSLGFVTISCVAVTSFLIYKTAALFLSKNASYISVLIFLFSPAVALDLLKQTTYDTPLILFWTATLYCVARFISFKQKKDLLLVGLSIGLMLLSKYSGVVLVLALLVFLLLSDYRSLFKNYYFYLACILAVIVFSPVLLWNYKNEWQSFIYQLNTHKLPHDHNAILSMMRAIFNHFLPLMNVALLTPIICRLKSKTNDIIFLCICIFYTLIIFYLGVAIFANVRSTWLTVYIVSAAILFGVCYEELRYRKAIHACIIIYALISLSILLENTFHIFLKSPRFMTYSLLRDFNEKYDKLPQIIITPGWQQGRDLFFLKSKPMIYTIDCDSEPQNQYALWSTEVIDQIKHKKIKEILFIDKKDRLYCIEKYFDSCKQIAALTKTSGKSEYNFFAYKCENIIADSQ